MTGVFGSSDSENTEKGAAHRVCGLKAAGVGYFFEPPRGAIDDLLDRFYAHTVNELAGVHSSFAEADARKMAGAHPNAFRERFDGEGFTKVLEHPNLKLPQWLGGDGLVGKHVAVLRLSSRTDQEHDQEARNPECCFVAVVFFYQGSERSMPAVIPADV